jgi:hypothetical protein
MILVLFSAFSLPLGLAADSVFHSPRLLLTPQRAKRLSRDRERQTVRWASFENRVQTGANSPERGFELALYYAVTHDESRGREAVVWALAHPCERRQVALVLDWCSNLVSADERKKLAAPSCPSAPQDSTASFRDALFLKIAQDQDVGDYRADWQRILKRLTAGNHSGPEIYAVSEYLATIRTTQHVDLRQDSVQLFSLLPTEFLLALRPKQVRHPDWQIHVAALALVGLDPNLEGSQFLQGWAMEDGQTLHDGRGVAYEFLWADPYLPGIGYQNLDPWAYDASGGRLFARSNWEDDACWISISSSGATAENCPPNWKTSVQTFGHLTLVPISQNCYQAPNRRNDESVILWQNPPNQLFTFDQGKQQSTGQADAAGMWRLSANVEGKVCRANR